MEIFEIHITGTESIIDLAKKIPIKTIVIDLLKPDKSHHRTEYMTSQVHKAENYQACKDYVDSIVPQLGELHRVKIECPYYEHYVKQSVYIESHFSAVGSDYPISKNKNKSTFLGTDREYKIKNYGFFRRRYKGVVVELCLYDSNVKEDQDWFDLYKELK